MSIKKFIVDLSDQERHLCLEVVKKLKGTSQKVKRANVLPHQSVRFWSPHWQ